MSAGDDLCSPTHVNYGHSLNPSVVFSLYIMSIFSKDLLKYDTVVGIIIEMFKL